MKTFCCPVEKITYKNACVVTTCPAHDKKSLSGCIYQEVKEVSIFSIGHRWRLTNAQIKKSYKAGIKILTDTAKFYHLAQQHYSAPLKSCSNCGVAGPDCINTIRCNKRAKFANLQLTRIPLRVLNKPTIQFFWVTIENPVLQEFFKPKTVLRAKRLLSRRIKNDIPE